MSRHNLLSTKVSLTLSCKDLKSVGSGSSPNTFVQVVLKQDGEWTEVGRTELLKITSNIDFTDSTTVDYTFEDIQELRFIVCDADHNPLGYLECHLALILKHKSFSGELLGPKENKIGTITIVAKEVGIENSELKLQFSGKDLDNKDVIGKSDPYFEISKDPDGENEHFIQIYQSDHIENTLNPKWDFFYITVNELCVGDVHMRLRISCYDYDTKGDNDLIGELFTTVHELTSSKAGHQWELINPKKKHKKRKYTNSGYLTLESVKVVPMFSFLDYVMSGGEISLTVGIDFTASNGDPTKPCSLHYINLNEPNEYIKSLITVGEVCQDYDTDKMFPAYGFGAKVPPNQELSFDFPLNFNLKNPYCSSVLGIVSAYQRCLRKVQPWGPTNVAPIINHVISCTQERMKKNESSALKYSILLLMTDGVVTDMDETVNAIVAASYLPISIIIIGIGKADFSVMRDLDCDVGKLKSSKGIEAFRDIVQFIPFLEYKDLAPAHLARAVLGEVPTQVSEYFKLKRNKPLLCEYSMYTLRKSDKK